MRFIQPFLRIFWPPSGEPVAGSAAVEKMKKGTIVDVWFSDVGMKMQGKVVSEVAPGILRVKITAIVDKLFSDDYEWLVGEVFEMRRIHRREEFRYDDYGWSPVGEELL